MFHSLIAIMMLAMNLMIMMIVIVLMMGTRMIIAIICLFGHIFLKLGKGSLIFCCKGPTDLNL